MKSTTQHVFTSDIGGRGPGRDSVGHRRGALPMLYYYYCNEVYYTHALMLHVDIMLRSKLDDMNVLDFLKMSI